MPQVSSSIGTSVSIGSQPGMERNRNLGPDLRTADLWPAVRVMGVAGWWNGGDVIFGAVGLGKTVFTPMGNLSQSLGTAYTFPLRPEDTSKGHVTLPESIAQSLPWGGVLVVWELADLPSRAVPADGSERVVAGLVCVCRVVCRHAEPCRCFIYLATESVEEREGGAWAGR